MLYLPTQSLLNNNNQIGGMDENDLLGSQYNQFNRIMGM